MYRDTHIHLSKVCCDNKVSLKQLNIVTSLLAANYSFENKIVKIVGKKEVENKNSWLFSQ